MRPCTVTAAAPASSTIRASTGALISSSFQPARIFTVTGIFTALAIAAMIAAACAGSRIRLQPALCFAIFGTGQPMLTSTMSAPMPSTIARGVGHLGRIAAEDLDRDRTLFLGVLGVLERAVDAADQALGADHLGDDEPAAALALDQAAERGVGHAGHRRDANGRVERDLADLGTLEGLRLWRVRRRDRRQVAATYEPSGGSRVRAGLGAARPAGALAASSAGPWPASTTPASKAAFSDGL